VTTQLRRLVAEIDVRVEGREPPTLLAVSQHRGVVPRSELTQDTPRADSFVKYKVCAPGDLVLNRFNAYRGALGIAKTPGMVSPDYLVLRPSSDVSSMFLDYLLRSDWASTEMLRSMGGLGAVNPDESGFSRIDVRSLLRLDIVVDSPLAQRRIAEFLDRETAQIDALIAKQQQLISTLAERRASVVGFSMTRGMADSATLKDSGVYWLGDIPSHWRVNRFSRVVRINAGQIDPREPRFAPMTLIAPNHIQKVTGRILTLETAQDQGADSGKYFVRRGQVIYSKIRPGLRKATIAPSDCLCSADMYALSADPSQLRDEFLLELMLSEPFTQFTLDVSARVAMPKVNQETLSAASLWYPSLEEQDRILSTLHSAVERIDTLDLKARELTGTLLERRQALISAAVTGQINVGGAST
jgi:type I restriction enzyme S subunit